MAIKDEENYRRECFDPVSVIAYDLPDALVNGLKEAYYYTDPSNPYYIEERKGMEKRITDKVMQDHNIKIKVEIKEESITLQHHYKLERNETTGKLENIDLGEVTYPIINFYITKLED